MSLLAAFGWGIVAGAAGSFVFVFAFRASRQSSALTEVDGLRDTIDDLRGELRAARRERDEARAQLADNTGTRS